MKLEYIPPVSIVLTEAVDSPILQSSITDNPIDNWKDGQDYDI